VPAGIVLVRGDLAEAVVGYKFVTGVAVMVFALLAGGFGRPSLFEFPVLLVAAVVPAGVTLWAVVLAICSAVGAVLLALVALYWRRLPLLRRGFEPGAGLTVAIQRIQSGVINDYVTWIVAGLACIGGVLALIVRR
jgi:hypothetical protein